MDKKYVERAKDFAYGIALAGLRIYWRVAKPKTFGARLILVREGKVLLVSPRRSQYWNLPGGGTRRNEDPSAGALRELREETGILVPAVSYRLGTYVSGAEGKRDTVFIFVAEAECFDIPRLEIELRDARWFSLDALPEGTTRPTRYRLSEYLQGVRSAEGEWTRPI